MQILLDIYEENLIVKVKGELDHHTSEQARDKIDCWYLEKRCKNIILDTRELSFMDSSGIGLIIGRYKMCNENGGSMIIVNEGKNIERILKMAGIFKIIQVYSSLDDALINC